MKTKKLFKYGGKLITITGIAFLAYFSTKYFNVKSELDRISSSNASIYSDIKRLQSSQSEEIDRIHEERIVNNNQCDNMYRERFDNLSLGIYTLERWCSQIDSVADRSIKELNYKYQVEIEPLKQDLRSLARESEKYSSLREKYISRIATSIAVAIIGFVLILGKNLIMSFINSKVGWIGDVSHSEFKDNVKIAGEINEAPNQNLADAANEIQQLLEQLSKTYPTTTSREKNIVVGEAVDRIENNPTLKARVLNALKAGGTESFKEAVNHPLVNILVASIEGWLDSE